MDQQGEQQQQRRQQQPPQAQAQAPSQTQPTQQPEQAQQGNVMPMMNPTNSGIDQTAMNNGMNGGFGLNGLDPNAMNPMGEHSFFTPEALNAMMQDQPVLPDPSMAAMSMGGDAAMMMPFPMQNGQGVDLNGPSKAPKGVSAGESWEKQALSCRLL